MNYYDLRSLLESKKKPIPMAEPAPSFEIHQEGERPYIETSYEKVLFTSERPTIVLLSAVGATGKSVLARKLSEDTGLPLLNLSEHKPVGANTLTGLLTTAYEVGQIGAVFQGLAAGSFGLIVDGIDEGRSKTTEKAFDAFLDDIVKLCRPAAGTTMFMLGRTQTVDDCWTFFADAGIPVGLVTISPFDLDSARRYIDTFTGVSDSQFTQQYREVRDYIINKLGAAFSRDRDKTDSSFLSFIGYPPVLDAIVTLLQAERNYHGLLLKLSSHRGENVELRLLGEIAGYILMRERDLKVIPNIVKQVVADAPADLQEEAIERAFSKQEQCIRLIAYVLGAELSYPAIPDPALNERYEEQLRNWIPEHPFLLGGRFRNAVFEAVAVATVLRDASQQYQRLAGEHARKSKSSYHLIYMLDGGGTCPVLAPEYVGLVIAAALEFRSTHWNVAVEVVGESIEEEDTAFEEREIAIEVEVSLAEKDEGSRTFRFSSTVDCSTTIDLGARLAAGRVSLPCDVQLHGSPELELGAPVEIEARVIRLSCEAIVLRPVIARPGGRSEDASEVILVAERVESEVQQLVTNEVDFSLVASDLRGIAYPLIQFAEKRDAPPADPLLRQKYLRARRILSEFRSHSRGSMARYRSKIESERVLKNEVGGLVLRNLLDDGVLRREERFYFLEQEELARRMGITWHDLRRGRAPGTMLEYLRGMK